MSSAAPKYMAVQGAAMIVGAVLVLLGVLGFVPGVTAHVDQLAWFGRQSGALLFGTFTASVLLNLTYVVVGAAGFYFTRSYSKARAYLLAGGVLFVGLWFYGTFVEVSSNARVIPLNAAANWLHLGLGAVMALLAVTLAGQHDPTKRRARIRRPAPQ